MEFFQKIYKTFFYSAVESTNSTIQQLYKQGQVLPIVIAEQQIAGRGTQGKTWHSPVGNLYFSFIIEQDLTPLQAGQLSLLTGLSIYYVLKDLFLDANFLCKWPNDILLNNKKVGGILIEKAFTNDCSYFIIGIGLNIEKSLPASHFPSTSLKEEHLSLPYAMSAWWAEKIIGQLSVIYTQWIKEGFEYWHQTWNKCCYGWEKEVHFRQEKYFIKGKFNGIDSQGNILIESYNGLHRLTSGSLQYYDKKV